MIEKLKYFIKASYLYLKDLFNTLNFQAKLIVSIILGISLLVTLCSFLIVNNIQSNIDNQVHKLNYNLKTSQSLANLGGQVLVKDYIDSDHRKAKLLELSNEFINQNPDISYIIFTDNSGNILYESKYASLFNSNRNSAGKLTPPQLVPFIKISDSQSGKILNIAEPIQYNSNLFGWVWIGFPDIGFTIVGSKKELVVFLIEIFVLVWILSIIGAIINSLIIINPLKKLEKSAKAITDGRFGFQLPLKGLLGKELTQLVKAFNQMSKRLQQYEESNLAILSSERNKFESVVMSIADGVIVVNRSDNIQIINPTAAKLLERSSDELLGQDITMIWDIRTNKFISDYLKKSREETHNNFSEIANFDLVRENRNIKLLITPLYENGEHLGAVLVLHDRTKEAEVELIKQEFISNVSHELRTPITSIKCYVDTLYSHSNDIDEKTKNDFLSTINEETDRLSNLVNDVLELSRLESPSRKLQLSIQEIKPCLDYALKSIKVLADKKSISLQSEIEANLPFLKVNQENIERILVNLLSNAIKYTPGNGVVKLVVKKADGNVLFQIIDNGIGIEEEFLPLIFERFYRVENKVHTIKGTGLGLTIVKKSIEQHGGKISVKSKLGEGSIFEFSIPIPIESFDDLNYEKESAAV